MTANANNTKCGFVALIGAPNAGKSCLLNALVGGKVSIVSPKVQTTRTRITGIITEKDTQAVFIDTPGIFKPRRRLDRAMVAAAHDARDGADIVAIIVDVGRKDAVQTVRKLLDRMPDKNGRQIILIMNKIDLSTHAKLLPLTLEMSKIYNWDSVFMISATRDNGVADIKTWILKNLPDSPFHYDPSDKSDQPDALLAAEITREKLFLRLHEELPYGLHVETVDFESENDTLIIHQDIIISESRHKGMVIGKSGSMLKQIGTMAREEMENIFGRHIRLNLEVIVREGWDEKSEVISGMGLDPSA
jgi:GTP-binding protein Era